MVLTGPATRRAVSPWSGEEPTFDPHRVYLFVGDGDPQLLGRRTLQPEFVYEVQPSEGKLCLDQKGRQWDSVSCESALIVACAFRPPQDHEKEAERRARLEQRRAGG